MTARMPIETFASLSIEDARSDLWLPGWDFLRSTDYDELAAEMIDETHDPSWALGSRRVLAALIRFLAARAREERRRWTWLDLHRLLQRPIDELYATVLSVDPAAAEIIDVTRDETRRQAFSYYLVLIANVGLVVKACAMMGRGGRPFSLRRWLHGKDERKVLILRQSPRVPQLSALIARLILKVAADVAVEQTDETQPIWFVLDELPQIGKTDSVPRLAAIGRSAGVRLVVSLQSLAQIRDRYGEQASQHLLDNLTTKIVGRIPTGRTANEISKDWIGERTVRWSEDAGRGNDGDMRTEVKLKDIPVASPFFLAKTLGLRHDLSGRGRIRALVTGYGDVAMLEWMVGRWPVRRPALVTARTPRSRRTGAPASKKEQSGRES